MSDDETVPLDEEYLPTVFQDGREYQQFALQNLHYFEPIDDHEMVRINDLHNVLMLALNNRLLPSELTRPRKILELGVGTGDWAVEVAKTYPACEVVAVDICPHMWPEEVPDNLILQVDNINESFTWPRNEFDFVHSQMMVGVVNKDRWQPYIRDIFRTLRRGGWCEMVEIYFNAQSDNGTLTDDHALRRWSKGYMESIQPLKNPRAPLRMARWMREAGFTVNEEPRPIPLPTCGWPTDPRQQEVGRQNREQVRSMLSSVALYPMTVFQGMAVRDFEIMVAQARNEADNPAYKAYFSLYVCRGQKPR
ncbi:UMTA methyltransferase [Plectosphaerella plurivora]|uniref:UMTA methyltransferase n=1 Tax=Plectosphaerella plurivora TaxID=936078 RepID=A0A9P9ABI6_9PEZI|nr:UMTA methyltransferase [Plectosphaerella plurivora]